MSDDEENANLYTTRAWGDLRDELDVYIQESGDSKSKALRELLEIGLESQKAGGRPTELKQEIKQRESEVQELKQDLEELQSRETKLNAITILFTFSVVLPVLTIGIGTILAERGIYRVPQDIIDGVFLAVLLLLSAAVLWRIYLGVKPLLYRVVTATRARVG